MGDENIGRVLAGKYELVRVLGQGGMGAVYEGRNQIGKRVAVKLLLKPEFAQNRALTARFFREAQASAAAESKHVVDVYDTGVDEGTGFPFIIMAYLSGEDLEHLVSRVGALNPTAAARIVSQAATGLAKAHEVGIVHRDIKPANIFLATEDGESTVKVLDFGIAKLSSDLAPPSGDDKGLTQTGALLGTPLYMSPEQAQGLKTIDSRTDIWSLGMCLYQALAGRLPFTDIDTIGKLIVAIVAREVPPLSATAPWVRPELAAVVQRTLERDVEKRFSTSRELIAALRPFTDGALTISASVLVGVQGALDATLLPGAEVAAATPGPEQTMAAVGGTTGAVAGNPREPTKGAPTSRRAAYGVAAVVVAGAVAFGARALVGKRETAPISSVASAATITAPAAAPPAPAAPEDDVKVGMLTLKMPAGSVVKVDGFPAGPGNAAAPHVVTDGKLALRGEFQRKFLVAIYDKTGKRLMVQDVYLYDNKVDPETIDTSVGAVTVEKPRRKLPASPSTSAVPAAQSGVPASPAADLPARF
jgi:eukaryotic-like serine/threonine-protein kinase